MSAPPRGIALTAEVRWVLNAAFAAGDELAPPADAGAAVSIAHQLGLAPRIAARRWSALGRMVPGEVSENLARTRALAVAQEMRLLEAGREVAAVADAIGVQVVFLKHLALEAAGVLTQGSRPAADVDVLAAPDEAGLLDAELLDRGWSRGNELAEHHHLPALHHPQLGMLEIHVEVPGMSVAGGAGAPGRGATLAQLAAGGLIVRQSGPFGSVLVPSRTFLVAHAVAHGLIQHGLSPAAYPGFRALADLMDLGVASAGGEGLLLEACDLLDDRAQVEARSAGELCRLLAYGDVEKVGRDTPAGRLLAHLLAGALDADYRAALKLRHLGRAAAASSGAGGTIGWVRRALLPTRDQLAVLYGRPSGRLGWWRIRVRRPFDLIWRLLRYARSWTRLRLGSPDNPVPTRKR